MTDYNAFYHKGCGDLVKRKGTTWVCPKHGGLNRGEVTTKEQ